MKKLLSIILFFQIYTCACEGLGPQAVARETPPILNYPPTAYKAHKQNWALHQNADQFIYAANSDGLLEFDGSVWKLYPFPDGQIVRAVLCDDAATKAGKGRIYVGGFGEFGFWKKNERGQLRYVSLSKNLPFASLKTEEIWNILKTPSYIYFQSFSRIYRYDGKKVVEIAASGNFMFLHYVQGRLLIQLIGRGLHELIGEKLFPIPGTDSLAPASVSSILSFDQKRILVATAKHGLYLIENNTLTRWTIPLAPELTRNIINKAIVLRNNQGFAFGTIKNGLYILDQNGQLKLKINKQNVLQNNTVLALTEDRAGNLWAGLDQGIDLIRLRSPLLFYNTVGNPLGTTYAAALWKGNLYVGSNNGVFVKKWLSSEEFRPIPGLEGQVWNLSVVNDELLCGHNDATFRITESGIQKLSNVTGGWIFLPVVQAQDTFLIQGAYNGLHVYRKMANHWTYAKAIKGVPPLPIRQIVQDETGGLWLAHAYKGLYYAQLNSRLDSVLQWKELTAPKDISSTFSIEINRWKNKIYFRSGQSYFESAASGELKPATDLPPETEPYKIRTGISQEWFRVFNNRVELHSPSSTITRLDLSLIRNSETILALDSSYYFFCLDNGYALYNRNQTRSTATTATRPVLRRVMNLLNTNEDFSLKNGEVIPAPTRSLRISYALPVFGQPVYYQYRLMGLSEQWSDASQQSFVEYTNLAPGEYTFELRSSQSTATATYTFTIAPFWYETLWAKMLTVLVGLVMIIALVIYQEKRFKVHRKKLLAEQEEKLRQHRLLSERRIMEIQNENLQKEIKNKSQQLSNVAINVVRKNEILEEIRDELQQVKEELGQQLPTIHYQKLLNSIERNVAGKEDWVLFEDNFNEIHEEFFMRLRNLYPTITPSELRLAACLRMNLSTKEMAPVLGISVRGVEIKRYRLRRKLGLDPDVNLVDYMLDI
ncbi:triple tyrosine motif-containing protein [Arundinibacter roseus]|uniref:LuxR family transcriptional regulator n=1 Tax=Arundinibacter roseus TaxID=2070510 RepID=A0A4R4K4H3_9BACT|nr:triple tyrosine motif-containing protein [Arundinibacter roseus]TDB62344.1 LuxR family transcriptional regulator [Arundinibacter roseus]